MNLTAKLKANPMVWKDYISVVGVIITVSTVLLQGGKILERLDSLAETQRRHSSELAQARIDITTSRGVDILHSEQIANLKARVEAVGMTKK